MSTISASTTSTTGYVVTSDTTGTLVLQTGATPTTAVTVASNQQVTFAQPANLPNTFGFKNRIINGGMVIDQRNSGASVTINNTAVYTLDRWYDRCVGGAGSAVMTVQRSTTAPTGFTNSKLTTVTTSKSPAVSEQFWFYQADEALNMSDFGMGTASAVTFTLSFWVRASVTGTYSVAFQNSAQNRSYVATYTVNAANTFEYKTLTITGDTTGTWLTDNGVGMYVFFDTGSGSNFNAAAGAWTAGTYYRTSGSVSLIANSGATFYITGVQLEKGSTATSFDYRPYGTELALCQRYLPALNSTSTTDPVALAFTPATTIVRGQFDFKVTPRTPPTGITVSSASHFSWDTGVASGTPSAISFTAASSQSARFALTVTGATAGNAAVISFSSASGQILFTGCEL